MARVQQVDVLAAQAQIVDHVEDRVLARERFIEAQRPGADHDEADSERERRHRAILVERNQSAAITPP